MYPPGWILFEKQAWSIQVTRPLGDIFVIFRPDWTASMWLAGGWIGWVTGYRVGRRWGRSLPALFVSSPIVGILGYALYRATRLGFGGEWIHYANPGRDGAREWFSGALFVDTAFVLVALLVLGFLVEDALSRHRRRLPWWLRWGPVLVVWVPIFIAHRSFLLSVVDPWPPPALRVHGLDPVTGRLWAGFGSGRYWPWNQYLFALDYPRYVHSARNELPQKLYSVSSVRYGLDEIVYDRFAPFLLVSPREGGTPIKPSCRTLQGIRTIPVGNTEAGMWYPVRSSDRTWYAFANREYDVAIDRDENGRSRREFRSRLFLYCPETGESKTAIIRPTLPARVRPPKKGSGYEVWPGTAYTSRQTNEAVTLTFRGSEDGGGSVIPLADGFLGTAKSEPSQTARIEAFLHPEENSTIALCAHRPAGEAHLLTIPSSDASKGCVWDPKTGHLQVYINGQRVGSGVLDATSESAPAWSPNGEYLVYLSGRGYDQDSEWVLKMAYPKEKMLFKIGWAIHLAISWSPDSKWLAVRNDTGHLGLPIVHFPDLSTRVLMPVPNTSSQGGVRLLHDGSVAFVSRIDGKIYAWRPEWEEPVCVYDPGRETVLRSTK